MQSLRVGVTAGRFSPKIRPNRFLGFSRGFHFLVFLRGVQLESMSDFIAIDIGNQNMMVARWNSKAHNELGNDISFVYSDYHEKKIPYDYAERVTN